MTGPAPELSRLVPRGELARGGVLERVIEADAAERAALARRFDLVALDRLVATLRLRPGGGGGDPGLIALEGHLSATATQRCVVTLEDLPVALEADFELLYTLAGDDAAAGAGAGAVPAAVEIDAEAEDPPEPVGPRGIDLGEAVAEQLALALEPYPRAPGVRLEDVLGPGEPAPEPEGPFAALAALKKRD